MITPNDDNTHAHTEVFHMPRSLEFTFPSSSQSWRCHHRKKSCSHANPARARHTDVKPLREYREDSPVWLVKRIAMAVDKARLSAANDPLREDYIVARERRERLSLLRLRHVIRRGLACYTTSRRRGGAGGIERERDRLSLSRLSLATRERCLYLTRRVLSTCPSPAYNRF